MIPCPQAGVAFRVGDVLRVSTMFDYNPEDDDMIPCPQSGVSFRVGDVLRVSTMFKFVKNTLQCSNLSRTPYNVNLSRTLYNVNLSRTPY